MILWLREDLWSVFVWLMLGVTFDKLSLQRLHRAIWCHIGYINMDWWKGVYSQRYGDIQGENNSEKIFFKKILKIWEKISKISKRFQKSQKSQKSLKNLNNLRKILKRSWKRSKKCLNSWKNISKITKIIRKSYKI